MGKLAIIGLGLVGGSMGLALNRANSVKAEIVGYDRDRAVGQRALKAKAIHRLEPTPEEAARGATIVVIATPITAVKRVFEEIAPHLQAGTVVTDVSSTKSDVLEWAEQLLPPDVHFVGGHPMAGKESSGPEAAEAGLFDGRPYCVLPGISAANGAVNAVLGLATAIGARPFFLDPKEHDAYAAAISHVPLMASVALFSLVKGSAAWPEMAGMAGPAFNDLTRLASGQPEMAHDIFLTNRENVLHWVERYIAELRKLADLIESDDNEGLFRDLAEVQMQRETFLSEPPRHADPGRAVDVPTSSEAFISIMGGGLWRERAKELTDSFEETVKKREREARLRRKD